MGLLFFLTSTTFIKCPKALNLFEPLFTVAK